MVKHYCDRCGKERAYTALRTLSVRDWEDATNKTYEICEDCEKELKNWIANETPIDKIKAEIKEIRSVKWGLMDAAQACHDEQTRARMEAELVGLTQASLAIDKYTGGNRNEEQEKVSV